MNDVTVQAAHLSKILRAEASDRRPVVRSFARRRDRRARQERRRQDHAARAHAGLHAAERGRHARLRSRERAAAGRRQVARRLRAAAGRAHRPAHRGRPVAAHRLVLSALGSRSSSIGCARSGASIPRRASRACRWASGRSCRSCWPSGIARTCWCSMSPWPASIRWRAASSSSNWSKPPRTAARSVIFSSHIVSDIERLANRIWILKDGRLDWQGDLDSLKESVVRLHLRGAAETLRGPLEIPGRCRVRREGNFATAVVRDWTPQALQSLAEPGAPSKSTWNRWRSRRSSWSCIDERGGAPGVAVLHRHADDPGADLLRHPFAA